MQPQPQQPTSIVLPVIGMLAVLPGALMHSFALHEASRLGNDWVGLSTPLLVISAASFAWLLRIKLGTVGLSIGAVLGLGVLGAAFVNLHRTITKRAQFEASAAELDLTKQRFCSGDIKPNPKALSVNERGGNSVVLSREPWGGSGLMGNQPDPYQIENTALVACLKETPVTVESCTGYDNGGMVNRARVDLSLKVFSIKTGTLLLEKALKGAEPRACGSTEKFAPGQVIATIQGKTAEPDLVAELGPLLAR